MIELGAALLRAAPSGSTGRILEVGTGSGKTTRQLLAQGARPLGVDLSLDKLRRLSVDLSGCLAQADAGCLPFASASFDAVITVHVMHLIDRPAPALHEFRRVLRPGGAYLDGGKRIESPSIWSEMRSQWDQLLARRGLAQRHSGRPEASGHEILSGMGATCEPRVVQVSEVNATPAEEIDRLLVRVSQGAWQVPVAILPELEAALRGWAEDRYGRLELSSILSGVLVR